MKEKSKLPIEVGAVVAMIAFAGGTIMAVSLFDRKNTLNTMTEMTNKRTQLIGSFIDEAQKMLTIYADTPEIKNMLNDPENESDAEKAQEFTEYYSMHIDDLESIYACDLSTRIRTHNNSQLIGAQTRADIDSANKLVQAVLDSEDKIYNSGIILSPASGTQIVSLYKMVYGDDDSYLGLAGLVVKAEPLFNNDIPSLNGLKGASYKMINVNSHQYIFNDDPEMVGKEATNDSILSLCSELSETDDPAKGNIEYKDDIGSYIAAYSFMPEYDILVMLEGETR